VSAGIVIQPCHARKEVEGEGGDYMLTCTLPEGHRGPHKMFEFICTASWPKDRKRHRPAQAVRKDEKR
jgi:hypothetical protein